ncbi:MAG: hypothetical protein RSE04_07645 [Hydrogenoanaerobacterium sp.]
MFAVLKIKKTDSIGIFAKLLQKIKRHKIKTELIKTPKCSYLLIVAECEDVPWGKVEAVCGRACRSIVLPRYFELPQGTFLKRFMPTALANKVLINTCIEVIRRCHLPLYRKTVTLVDSLAAYTELVPNLLSCCITVKVVTQRQEIYKKLSYNMMEEIGAGIIVTDEFGEHDKQGDCLFVICPDGNEAAALDTDAPVFTLGNIDCAAKCKLVGDIKIAIRGELSHFLPRGIDPMDFAGALYEYSGKQSFSKQTAVTLRCGRNILTPYNITEYLELKYHKPDQIYPNYTLEA